MGFTSGFLGGVALTSSILYLSIAFHRTNRYQQSTLLRQQNSVLRNVLDPLPPTPPPSTREARTGLVEMSKDGWNRNIENLVKTVNETDWAEVRGVLADRLVGVAGRVRDVAGQVKDVVVEKTPSLGEVSPVQKREG